MNSGYTQVISVMNPNSTQLNVVVQRQSGDRSYVLKLSHKTVKSGGLS
jgi:hypothetical protein